MNRVVLKYLCLASLLMLFIMMIAGCSQKVVENVSIKEQEHSHNWIEATCTEPKRCSICGETEGEALGHIWKEADCISPKTCLRCLMVEGESLGGHEWQEATCTKPKTCKRCGETEGNPLGHDTPKLTCTDNDVCTRCGEEILAKGHSWKEATCTDPRTCIVCGKSEGNALGHEKGEPKIEIISEATCTTSGKYEEVIYCTRCSEELSREEKTEAPLGHTTSNGKCSRCGNEIYEVVSGKGDDVITGVNVGTGLYRVHFTNSGSSNFIVHSYDDNDDRELLVNEIGKYDGYVFLQGESPYTFEIKSNGKWTLQIESIGETTEKSFSGKGDYVTDKANLSSGVYEITHTGKSNIIVRMYTTDGRDLLVNEIGKYYGKVKVTIPSGSLALFEITADGNWTINKVG